MEGVQSSLQTDYTLRVRVLQLDFFFLSRIALRLWASIFIGVKNRLTEIMNSSIFDNARTTWLSTSISDNFFLANISPKIKATFLSQKGDTGTLFWVNMFQKIKRTKNYFPVTLQNWQLALWAIDTRLQQSHFPQHYVTPKPLFFHTNSAITSKRR